MASLQMKYLDVPSLDEVSHSLTDRDLGIVTVNGAIHLYSYPSSRSRNSSITKFKAEKQENDSSGNAKIIKGEAQNNDKDKDKDNKKATVTPSPGQWMNATLSQGSSEPDNTRNTNPGPAPKSPNITSVFAGAGASKKPPKQEPQQPRIAVAIKSTKGQQKARSDSSSSSSSVGAAGASSSTSSAAGSSATTTNETTTSSSASATKGRGSKSRTSSVGSASGLGRSKSRTSSMGSVGSNYSGTDEFPIFGRGRVRSASIGGAGNSAGNGSAGEVTSEGRMGKTRSMSLGDWHDQNGAQRTLVELTSTLNEAFPDYDFSQAKLSSFVVNRSETVIRTVNSYFSDLPTDEDPHFLANMWAALDSEVKLKSCEVYSYVPDMEGDPFSEGSIWSFNYFFIDRESRKIAYFTCVACTNIHQHNSHSLNNDLNDNEYQTSDSEYGGVRSDPNSPDPYGCYGSPRVASTASDMEEEEYDGRVEKDGNVAMQAADDSDDSCDEMM